MSTATSKTSPGRPRPACPEGLQVGSAATEDAALGEGKIVLDEPFRQPVAVISLGVVAFQKMASTVRYTSSSRMRISDRWVGRALHTASPMRSSVCATSLLNPDVSVEPQSAPSSQRNPLSWLSRPLVRQWLTLRSCDLRGETIRLNTSPLNRKARRVRRGTFLFWIFRFLVHQQFTLRPLRTPR